jgi:23S rRNA (cytosine1962-C5)-methyltransferase
MKRAAAPPEVWLRGGPPVHPFVYSKRLLRSGRGAGDGSLVLLKTREGRPCGWGLLHTRSTIAVRVLTYDPDEVPDGEWLARRVAQAEALRRDWLRLPEETDAWRVVHAEADGLSGLVVDRYGSIAVASLFALGWALRLDEVREAVRAATGVSAVVARADPRAAEQEGISLPAERPVPEVRIQENGVRFLVDPSGGHKTGFFLDQRDNRRVLARIAKGRRVLDGCCYTGGFALAAARGGAASVRGIDLDEEAVARAGRNARENGLDVAFAHQDLFDALRALAAAPAPERPEVLVLDPPKWARDRAGLGSALARYRDLNRLALRAVADEGVVMTHSCSGLVSEGEFLDLLRGAALDARREVRFLRIAGAAPDHPVGSTFPEGRYLKSVLMRVGPPRSGPGIGAPGEPRGAEGEFIPPRRGPRGGRSASSSPPRTPSE